MIKPLNDASMQTASDIDFSILAESVFNSSGGTTSEKIDTFTKFASKKSISRFLIRTELFKKVLDVHGSIIECGVMFGAGLFSFAHLSSIFEPVNHSRRIIGFDTFSGFPKISEFDKTDSSSEAFEVGGYAGSSIENLELAKKLYDTNRPLSHIPKVEFIKGDICITAKEYIKNNPQLVISLLYLDMDIYEPTKEALKAFIPRIPRGGIIAFDELNYEKCPGETIAVQEVLGIKNLKLKRFPFDPSMSYHVVE